MDKNVKISYLRMEPASNGIVISYEKSWKPTNNKTFDGPTYKNMTEVFEAEPGESDEAFEKAFARYKELWKMCYKGNSEAKEVSVSEKY